MEQPNPNPSSSTRVYWRVEGSLADLTTVRPIAFFTWNAQTFLERWVRRGMVLLMAVLRPFLYAANRIFATRMVHTVLRGISRDRLDLLGEEYFKYKLQPYLKNDGMELLKSRIEAGDEIVLVSQGLEHVMRPLALHLGVKWLIANRLEFRDGIATGTTAGTGGAAAWTLRRHQWFGAGWPACGDAIGARSGFARRGSIAGRRGAGFPATSAIDSADCLFRWHPAHGTAFDPPGARREAHHAHWRDRLHR